ncbi:MAG: hypothetical protein ACRDTU_09395 [Micromonosporaceae bacterium]
MTVSATSTAAARLLDNAVAQVGPDPDLRGVEALANWLAHSVAGADRTLLDELAAADAESRRTGEGVVLGIAGTGHTMVVRHFPEGQPTPIHGHGGWGAVVVLAGTGRYETWEPTTDGFAQLVSLCELGPGDTLGWPDPPDDVHRQEGLDGGATELTVFARHPFHTWAPHFQPAGEAPDVALTMPQPRSVAT